MERFMAIQPPVIRSTCRFASFEPFKARINRVVPSYTVFNRLILCTNAQFDGNQCIVIA